VTELPDSLLRTLAAIVGEGHVLTGEATAGFAVDWTGFFRGQTPAVVRPRDTGEVAGVLALCTEAGVAVVPQGGNTGLVGGGVPRHGEVVLSLTRLNVLGPVDRDAAQVTAGAGVTLRQVAEADSGLDFGVLIASRDSATVGGAVATNAGGLRVLRFGPMRAQLRGTEAVLADGSVLSHLGGLVKDNTGYDYPSLLAGSEGTLAVITAARLRLVPRMRDAVTVIVGMGGVDEVHALAHRAVGEVPGLVSAEYFTQGGLDVLVSHAGLVPPLPVPAPAYLLLEAFGPGALEDLAAVIGDREAVVGTSAADRARLWAYRERHPEAAGFLGVPIKLDVSVPAPQWVRLASDVAGAVAAVDPDATVIGYGHVADGNVQVNIVPATTADGRHEDAVLSLVASLGGSISAEHGIGALKARWLPLARSEAERALFARIRGAFDPAGTLNPNVLPRLPAARPVPTGHDLLQRACPAACWPKTRLSRMSSASRRTRSSLPTMAPEATRRFAWRSRIRSMALRTLRALANLGWPMRSSMYSRKAWCAAGENRWLCRATMSSAIRTSSSAVKSGKSMWWAMRDAIPGLDAKNESIRSR
jgi:FAD/FMN-containing dehydrogenase